MTHGRLDDKLDCGASPDEHDGGDGRGDRPAIMLLKDSWLQIFHSFKNQDCTEEETTCSGTDS